MSAVGIDIGGTKIETRVFGPDWAETGRQRCATPRDYDGLVAAVADQVAWAQEAAGAPCPVGVGAAGLVNQKTGLALTANLVASGKPFPADIAARAGRPIVYVNDCRALALSEAVFGVGKGHGTVMSLNLGTGVAGGLVVRGTLLEGPTSTGGEYGHMPAPAHLISGFGLPIFDCGCGRKGCIETYISGRGLVRLARHLTGREVTTHDIADARHGEMAPVWSTWCALTAELIVQLTLTDDPDLIVLGGGLSRIDGVVADLTRAADAAQIGDFGIPKLVLAEGGDASGARGAAYAAWQEAQNA